MFEAINIKKSLFDGSIKQQILNGVDVKIGFKEMIAIMGASGCGKSTFLGISAGLDRPDSGKIIIESNDLYSLSVEKRNKFRNSKIGVIFQNHNLIPELNCFDNIKLPLLFGKQKINNNDIYKLMELTGISSKKNLYPYQMSGGENQRAAIARALITKPSILLADEVTGSLDKNNSMKILDIFRTCVEELETSILLVTHDEQVAARCDYILYMEEGRIVNKK